MSGYPQQQPYASPTQGSFEPPPKKGWSTGCVLGIIGTVVVMLVGVPLLCCGGIAGVGGFFYNVGMNMATNEIKQNPVVKQHVGEVSECTVNFTATGELKNREPAKGDRMVFDVKGSKGSGVVTVHIESQGEKVRIDSGTIRLPTGEEYDLVPR